MRKIFSILFALVLALSFSLVTAMPVVANGVTPDRVTVITNAADRLVANAINSNPGAVGPAGLRLGTG